MATFTRRLLLAAGLAPLAALAPAAQADVKPHNEIMPDTEAKPGAEIMIDNFTFSPAELVVAAGTRVTWINRDDIPHTIVDRADPRRMRSEPLDTGGRFAFTFTAPGSYGFFCSLHPHMQGTVVVR